MPPIYVGSRQVLKRYIGSTEVTKVCIGVREVLASASATTELSFLSSLPAGFALARGGDDRLARNNLGKWVRYSGNNARVHHSVEGAPLGLVLERSFVDKTRLGFNFASAPTDNTGGFFSAPTNVSMTPDPSSLAAQGFDAFTSALRFSAPSADSQWQIDTTVGNTNKHTIFGLVRDAQGSGGTTPSAIAISSGTNIPPSVFDEWQIVKGENITPATGTKISQVTCRQNHSFDVAGLWLVEAPYAPLPYWRSADNVQATISNEYATASLSGLTGWDSSNGSTIYYEWYHDRPFTVDGEPLVAFVDSGASGDYIKIGGRADGTLRIEAFIGGATVFSADFAAPARSTTHVAAIRLKPGAIAAAVDGVLSSVAAVSPSLANINTINLNKHASLYGNQFARSMTITAALPDDGAFAAGSTVSGGYL